MLLMQQQEVDEQVFWPRDSLFRYFELMEMLQYNLDTRKRLQNLAGEAQRNHKIHKYLEICHQATLWSSWCKTNGLGNPDTKNLTGMSKSCYLVFEIQSVLSGCIAFFISLFCGGFLLSTQICTFGDSNKMILM